MATVRRTDRYALWAGELIAKGAASEGVCTASTGGDVKIAWNNVTLSRIFSTITLQADRLAAEWTDEVAAVRTCFLCKAAEAGYLRRIGAFRYSAWDERCTAETVR